MLKKMKGLLDPSMKSEVDYEEAVKDSSNVLTQWNNGDTAGKRAFIPNIKDHDECYGALKIFPCEADEAKEIPEELCACFGKHGVHIYNQLLEMIGERDRNCLPFVNMCLRTWMEKMNDDADLWADMPSFDFDKWVLEKVAEPLSKQHGQKNKL